MLQCSARGLVVAAPAPSATIAQAAGRLGNTCGLARRCFRLPRMKTATKTLLALTVAAAFGASAARLALSDWGHQGLLADPLSRPLPEITITTTSTRKRTA